MSARAAGKPLGAALLACAAWLAVPALAAGLPGAAAPAASSSPAASGATTPAAGSPGDAAQQPTINDDRDVIEASEKWLRLLDRGQLGPAWDVSARTLQAQVTRAEWIKGIGAARKPFGRLATRNRDRFARAHQLPGVPDGDYAIVQFDSRFEGGRHATEQITWSLEPDGGVWRVAGYYIR